MVVAVFGGRMAPGWLDQARLAVQPLEKGVRGELDRLVAPLGGAVLAGDEPRPMDASEVPEHAPVHRVRRHGLSSATGPPIRMRPVTRTARPIRQAPVMPKPR